MEDSSTTNFHSLFGSICIDVVVIWVLDVEEFLLESDGGGVILNNWVSSSFIIGWFMVHGAVWGRIVLCIILVLILIKSD